MAKLRKIVIGAPRPNEKDEAEVRWSPLLGGGAQISLHGFAVLDNGVWKVNRASYQQIASMAGAPFRIEVERPGDEPPGDDPPA